MIDYGNNIIELNELCKQCGVDGHLLCYMSDMTGPTQSKKDGFARYIIDKMMANGELSFNQPIVVNGFQKFSLAVASYLNELGWTSELYVISHNQPIILNNFLNACVYTNVVPYIVDYVGHYPKKDSEDKALEISGVFVDQYSSMYGVEYYIKQAQEFIDFIPYELDAFINPNATGSTTLGIGTVLKNTYLDISVLCPDFVSSGNPNLGDDKVAPLIKDFDVEWFDRSYVTKYLISSQVVDGVMFKESWWTVNFGLSFLKNNPGKTVLLHIGG